MPAFRKTPLNLALGAALGTLVMVPSLSSAFSIDMDDQVLRTDDGGDTLLGAMYTTVYEPGGGGPIFDSAGNPVMNPDGTPKKADLKATTSYSITNTSETDSVVVKVRFREQKRSMEVADVMVFLSPMDQFSWWMGQDGQRGSGDYPYSRPVASGGPGERPFIEWRDESCVLGSDIVERTAADPTNNLPAVRRMTFPAKSKFVDSVEDMSFGHVEVIGMAAFSNGTVHGAIMGKNCNAIDGWFKTRAGVETDPVTDFATDVDDVLTGRFVVTANGQGVEFGENMQAVKDTFFVPYLTPQNNNACVADGFAGGSVNPVNPTNLLSHPCHSLYAWDHAESAHPHLGDANIPAWAAAAPQIPNLDAEGRANALSGDWSNNGENNVSTDWIINFPAKYVYLDYVNCREELSSNPNDETLPPPTQVREWCLVNYQGESAVSSGPTGNNNRRDLYKRSITDEGTPWGSESYYVEKEDYDPLYNTCLNGNYLQIRDIDEVIAAVTSPGPDENFALCNETTVLTMLEEGEWSGVPAWPSLIQYQDKRLVLEYEAFSTKYSTNRGIAKLDLNWSPVVGHPGNTDGAITQGLVAIQRRAEAVSMNNGTLTQLDRLIDQDAK
jgi:hypothetical protein